VKLRKGQLVRISPHVDLFMKGVVYADIFSIFQSEPRIFGLILLNLSRLLARRIKATNQHILDLKTPPKKAAA
jgi:hypothetical protein